MDVKSNWIAGRWQQAASGDTQANVSPVDTSRVLHEVPASGAEDVAAALDAADDALSSWRERKPQARGAVLLRASEALARRLEEAAELMAWEMGKPIAEARGEVRRSVDLLRYYAGWGWRLTGTSSPTDAADALLLTERVPLGVVSLITPWNFPSAIPVWKLAPALVTGNTAVLKPATIAPGSALLVAECLAEAELPAGVLNVVCGKGSAMGDQLIADPRVKAVSFTGSCSVGEAIFATSAGPQRRVGLEMGGKNPLIVADDADVDLAVELAVKGAMASAGQKCTATSRAIVDRSVLGEFTEKLLARVEALRVGNPLDESNDIGPVGDGKQLETILGYIDIGRNEDKATLAGGGKQVLEGECEKGCFVQPTVFTDVRPTMRIAREEVFGPVLCVLECDGFEQAMAMANDTPFGLSAAICTRDMSRAWAFARGIETGLVHINSTTTGAEVHVPFGGTKASSSGHREMGHGGIDFFTSVKTIYYTNLKGRSS